MSDTYIPAPDAAPDLERADPRPPGRAVQRAPAPVSELQDVLARGHRWLRFPRELEQRFQADFFAGRRLLISVCAAIGLIGVLLGTRLDDELMPDVAGLARILRLTEIALVVVSISLAWLVSMRWRCSWIFDAVTALTALMITVSLAWLARSSRMDTALTHSGAIVVVMLYVSVAARLRFAWTLLVTVVSIAVYMAGVEGRTEIQQAIVDNNVRLFIVGGAFSLIAGYAFEFADRRNWLLRRIDRAQQASLRESSERLRELSLRDPLTRLLNRRGFDAVLDRCWHEAARAGRGDGQGADVAMLLFDVDHFKLYNDSHGHQAGDVCLQRLADEFERFAQARGGSAARLGGEEFAVLLPDTGLDGAAEAAASLCAAVARLGIGHHASPVAGCVTVSAGVSARRAEAGRSPSTLLQEADRALYAAKSAGRNRVCLASDACAAEPDRVAALNGGHVAWSEHEVAAAPGAVFEAALHRGFGWLRFPGSLEAAYRCREPDTRRLFLSAAAIVGLLIFDVYVWASRGMYPDVGSDALGWLVSLTLAMLALVVAAHVLPLQRYTVEGMFAVGTAIVAVTSIAIVAESRSLTIHAYAAGFFLPVLYAGVAARLPFWFTCIPALATAVAYLVAMRPVGATQQLVFQDSLFVMANAMLYTLIAAYTLERAERREWLLSQIADAQRRALVDSAQRLRRQALLDPLTGVPNRRRFEADFDREWRRCTEEARPVGLLIVDIDEFKRYNDGYGHLGGDRCLQQVAALLGSVARREGVDVARLGGEEFGVLLPGACVLEAERVGRALCEAVRRAAIEHRHSAVADAVTVSVGAAAVMPDCGATPAELLTRADAALYRAKAAGRNRVVVWEPEGGGADNSPP